jgi:hypothetical protein
MRLALTFVLFGLIIGGADAQDRSSSAPQKENREYTKWIKRYRRRPKPLLRGFVAAKVWVTIWSIECEGNTPVSRSQTSCPSPMNMCQVSSSGLVTCQQTTCCPGFSGSYRKLKPKELEQLKMLLPHLPDDFAHLPPLGQRLVIQVVDKRSVKIRVYDWQQLPKPVKNVVDLVGLSILAFPQRSPDPQ